MFDLFSEIGSLHVFFFAFAAAIIKISNAGVLSPYKAIATVHPHLSEPL